MTSAKPKSALIAYCALASRLSTPGMGPLQALMPFFAEACSNFSGELFDAEKFSIAVASSYGMRIPRLAALGLAEQLCKEGLLEEVSRRGNSIVYRYSEAIKARSIDADSPPVNESEVEAVLQSFVDYCKTDARLDSLDADILQQAFLDRLLNLDSMRILSRREASIAAKRTAKTLTLQTKNDSGNVADNQEIHLDFLVSQFLLDLRDKTPDAFEQVSNVAFANMAAEAIVCFQEPSSEPVSLRSLTVYLDSPLLLDMLGVNTEYEEYGLELLEAIKANGATAAILDHCVVEAESAVHAQLTYLRSGVNQLSNQWGSSAKPDILAALEENIATRAEVGLGIEVHRDPDVSLHRRAASTVGSIETEMERRMASWRNIDAKEHDRKSVWSMISIRESLESSRQICDSKWLLLTRNTALVGIANDAWVTWLEGTTRQSRSVIANLAPIAMSDKQFAGYLWMRKGGSDGAISKARLLAHCSAAVRPRADVKSKAYNLVLELDGKNQADHIAALLEDREGAKALMRATQGDPEDVTKERLPFILEQVKIAAGEFAAAIVREESKKQFEAQRNTHEMELQLVREEAEKNNARKHEEVEAAKYALIQHGIEQQQLEAENLRLAKELREREATEELRQKKILLDGFRVGCLAYRLVRWSLAIFFGSGVYWATVYAIDQPQTGAIFIGLLSFFGFWFVPEFFDYPFSKLGNAAMRAAIRWRDSGVDIPSEPEPNFKSSTWAALPNNLAPKD